MKVSHVQAGLCIQFDSHSGLFKHDIIHDSTILNSQAVYLTYEQAEGRKRLRFSIGAIKFLSLCV